MAHGTGENEIGLKNILDFTRLSSILILLVHFYYYCYGAFEQWRFTTTISDRLLVNISKTGLFDTLHLSKALALGLLLISLLGVKGRKDEKIQARSVVLYCLVGGLLYWGSF